MPDRPLNSVQNAVRLLALFSPRRRQCGLSELARELGLSKQSTLRLIATLSEQGLIERVPDQPRYRLGIRLWELGCNAIDRGGRQDRWRPILEALAHETGLNVLLTAYAHGDAVIVDVAESRHLLQLTYPLGGRLPALITANGRPLLAHQPEQEIERVLHAGTRRFTPATTTAPEALRAELATVRREGVAIDRGEWDGRLWAVGAPVFDESGGCTLSLAVFGLADDLREASLERLIPLVKAGAQTLSRALGAPVATTDGGTA